VSRYLNFSRRRVLDFSPLITLDFTSEISPQLFLPTPSVPLPFYLLGPPSLISPNALFLCSIPLPKPDSFLRARYTVTPPLHDLSRYSRELVSPSHEPSPISLTCRSSALFRFASERRSPPFRYDNPFPSPDIQTCLRDSVFRLFSCGECTPFSRPTSHDACVSLHLRFNGGSRTSFIVSSESVTSGTPLPSFSQLLYSKTWNSRGSPTPPPLHAGLSPCLPIQCARCRLPQIS